MGSKSSGGDVDYPPFAPGGQYPSNADIPTLGTGVNPDGGPDWQPARVRNVDFGNTPAPKGRIILSVDDRDRSASTGIVGLPEQEEVKGPSCTAFFAGRVWYAGFTGEGFTSNILFSQVLFEAEVVIAQDKQIPVPTVPAGVGIYPGISLLGDCFQRQDPTVEDLNDLLDSDGGVIRIPEVGVVYDMIPVGPSLIVVSNTGTWEISGGLEGFKATNYTVNKVSSIGSISPESIVEIEGGAAYMAEDEIVAIIADGNGTLTSESLTDTTIKTLYEEIPGVSKVYARGYYDQYEQKIYWFYNDATSTYYDGINHKHAYNNYLVFDLVLNAWSRFKVEDDLTITGSGQAAYISIVGGYRPAPFVTESTDAVVVVNGEVVTLSSQNVTVEDTNKIGKNSKMSFLFTRWSVSSVAIPLFTGVYDEEDSGNYYDFTVPSLLSIEDVFDLPLSLTSAPPVVAHIDIGADFFQDLMRYKQSPYLYSYFESTETQITPRLQYIPETFSVALFEGSPYQYVNSSSCYMSVAWDWSNGPARKTTKKQQAYKTPKTTAPDEVAYSNIVDNFDPLLNFPTTEAFREAMFLPVSPYKEVVVSKRKIRGKGRSLSIRYENEIGKGFHILGYALPITASENT